MRWLVLVGLLIIGCAAESNMAKFPKPRTRDPILNIYEDIAASQKRNALIQPASASGYGGNGGQGSGSPAPVTNVQVTEEDGAPVVAVGTVKFPNTRVTDNSDGSASVVYHWTKTGTVLAPTTAGDTAEIAQTSTTGNALKVSRNLASGSTDNAVVEFIQDHASDNQVALNIQQHGDRGGLRVIRSGTGAASGATIFASTVDGSAIRGTTASAGNADYGGEFDRLDAGGYCDFDESSAPAAANGSNVRIYALNGGRMYQIDDSITIGPYGSELYNLDTETTTTSITFVIGKPNLVLADASGGAITLTLPAVGVAGVSVTIKKSDSSANAVTIDGSGAETIDGAATKIIATQYGSITMVSSGTQWWII